MADVMSSVFLKKKEAIASSGLVGKAPLAPKLLKAKGGAPKRSPFQLYSFRGGGHYFLSKWGKKRLRVQGEVNSFH